MMQLTWAISLFSEGAIITHIFTKNSGQNHQTIIFAT